MPDYWIAITGSATCGHRQSRGLGTRRKPFNITPMAVNSISFGPPHVRPRGRTCDGLKKSRKMPTRKTSPLAFVNRYAAFHGVGGDGGVSRTTGPMDAPVVVGMSSTLSCTRHEPFNYTPIGGEFNFAAHRHVRPMGCIQFQLALRTYAPWGARVVSLTKSRKKCPPEICPALVGEQALPTRTTRASWCAHERLPVKPLIASCVREGVSEGVRA